MAKALMKSLVRLCTLGEAVIEIGDRRYGPDAELVFASTLYLASHRGRRISRQTLLDLFWPRVRDDNRRHNLRQLVYKLRSVGIPCESDATHVTLRDGDVVADYDTYFTPRVAEPEAGRLEAPFGEFLCGYHPGISPGYAEWVEHRRAEVHAQMRRVLLASVSTLKQRGDWQEVERVARRVLEIDALNEEATLALAEATAMSGSKVAAVAMLDRYVEELGPGATEIRLPAAVLRRRVLNAQSGIADSAVADLPLIGRSDVVATLSGLLRRTRSSDSESVWLSGEPGIGKSRVAREIQLLAALEGFQLCIARADNFGRQPFGLIGTICGQVLQMPGSLGASTASYSALTRFAAGDSPTKDDLRPSSQETESVLAVALLDVLRAVSTERQLVVLVDDADRLEPASSRALTQLASNISGSRTLIIALGRRNSYDGVKRDFINLRLGPLSNTESETLLQSSLPTLPDHARSRCITMAAGNPLFLRELANHYRVHGDIARLPESIQKALEHSLGQVGETPLQVLQAIALLGGHSSLDSLEYTLGISASSMLSCINALEDAGLLLSTTLELRHPTIGELATAKLGANASRLLHRRIALALEQSLNKVGKPAQLAECMAHWREAHDSEHFAEIARRYATSLLNIGLPQEAVACLQEAADVADDARLRVAVLEQLVETHALTGQWEEVLGVWVRIAALERLTNRLCDSHSAAELSAIEAQWHLDAEPTPALARILRCVADQRCEVEHRLHALALGQAFADNAGDWSLKKSLHEIAHALVPTNANELALQQQAEVIYYTSIEDETLAGEVAADLVRTAARVSAHGVRLRSLRHASTALRTFGKSVEAEQLLLQAAQDALSHGLNDQAALSYLYLTTSALTASDVVRAEEYLNRAVSLDTLAVDQVAISQVRLARARIALLRGDSRSAIAALPSRAEILDRKTLRDRSALLAAWMAAHMASSASYRPLDADIELLSESLRQRVQFNSDFAASILIAGMLRQGDATGANIAMSRYIKEQRRRSTPLSRELQELLDATASELPFAANG